MEAWELALALAGSFVAGYVGSMLGLVLGTLRLPLIVALTGSPLAAAGTNIAISAASAGASASATHASAASTGGSSLDGASVDPRRRPRRSLRRRGPRAAALRGDRRRARLERDRSRVRPVRVADARASPSLAGRRGRARHRRARRGRGRDPRDTADAGAGPPRRHGREAGGGTNLVVGFLLGLAGFATHAGEGGVDWAILARRPGRRDPRRLAGRPSDGEVRRERASARARRRRWVLVGAVFAVQAVLEPERDRGDHLGRAESRRGVLRGSAFHSTGAVRADRSARLSRDAITRTSGEDRAQVADEPDSVECRRRRRRSGCRASRTPRGRRSDPRPACATTCARLPARADWTTVLRMLLAGEHDLDLAAVRLRSAPTFLPDELQLDRATDRFRAGAGNSTSGV